MRVGILDTKVKGQSIDNINLYKQMGYEIINSSHLDQGKKFDIVASTWTRLNEKRIKLSGIKGVVIKDNDEPGNVVDVDLLKSLNVPYKLIGLWGIDTRVRWNSEQIKKYKPTANKILMIANSPSHDALTIKMEVAGVMVWYPITPATHSYEQVAAILPDVDVIIVHLGKDDYHRYWLDPVLPYFKKNSLMISTTRGPIYSAQELNRAIEKNKITAVLDWAWEEDKLIKSDKIIHTGHSSYRSEESGTELSIEVVKSVEAMKRKLKL
jgi:hypothetical protein